MLFNDGGFTVDGGIVFRNCAQLFNLNGMKSMTAVGGDLVFENCPKITTNWGAGNCLSQIESVAGSVKLSGVAEPMAGVTFLSLRSVGGDVTVTVTGNGAESGGIPVESGSGQVGLDLLGELYRAGVFSSGAEFAIESNGTNYRIDEL